jgi:hypothetical protein
LDGKAVGYLHETSWQTAEGFVRSEVEQSMEIRRFGVPFVMTQTDLWIEDQEGGLVSVSSELDMNGQIQRIEARAAEETIRLQIRRSGEAEEFVLPLEDRARGVYGVGLEIAGAVTRLPEDGRLSYRLFSPETMKIEEFRLRVLGSGELSDSLGRVHRGILVEEQGSGLPGVVTTEIYDERGRFLYSKTPVGLDLEILRLEGDPRGGEGRETGAEAAAVFDVAALTVPVKGLERLRPGETSAVTVLFRGSGAAVLYEAVEEAVEDLDSPAGTSPDAAGAAPMDIVSVSEDSGGEVKEVVLRLVNEPGEDEWDRSGSEEVPQELRRYLEGGFHLDLTDPRLEDLLDRCRGSRGGVGEERAGGTIPVRCLERLVERTIENKSLALGFGGLEEVLARREGDCTEHALLLVALLRSSGVPARMAYGLILTEVGFIGHAWVEAYAGGRWRWLDPSFPGGRPYGLKIRLGVMDPAEPVWASLSLTLLQVAGTLEAELLEAVPR